MTPRDIAALGAVRIREGRERVSGGGVYYHLDGDTYFNRRSTVSPRAAELAAEIERLRGMLTALEQNYTQKVYTAHKIDTRAIAAGAGAGEVADE